MQEIVECVMNISEGRVIAKINAIADEIRANQHAFLLNTSSDPDHNRTVLSFIGTPSSISDAAFAATTKAIALITSHNIEASTLVSERWMSFPLCRSRVFPWKIA
jgi:glutamate formiminotransferase